MSWFSKMKPVRSDIREALNLEANYYASREVTHNIRSSIIFLKSPGTTMVRYSYPKKGTSLDLPTSYDIASMRRVVQVYWLLWGQIVKSVLTVEQGLFFKVGLQITKPPRSQINICIWLEVEVIRRQIIGQMKKKKVPYHHFSYAQVWPQTSKRHVLIQI